jgi:hypothetical protein
MIMTRAGYIALFALALVPRQALAQLQAPPAAPAPAPGASTALPPQNAPFGYYGYNNTYVTGRPLRSSAEISALYVTAVAYGVGAGVWLDAELGAKDPALFLIPPAVLGLAAPIAVYALDHPTMPRGMAAAISAGAVIGAGEGIGIASLQFVSSERADAWGFRGLSRATTLGATAGLVGGAVLGAVQRPSPRTSVFMTSGVVWGSAIGAMFGYGGSSAGIGYGNANDRAALGGFIGYNVGLAATAGLSTVYIPTTLSLEWMWAGAGIGFAASLPVFLLYAGKDGPPAKRALIFSGTATALGLGAGALFTIDSREPVAAGHRPQFARVTAVGPLAQPKSVGLSVIGELY